MASREDIAFIRDDFIETFERRIVVLRERPLPRLLGILGAEALTWMPSAVSEPSTRVAQLDLLLYLPTYSSQTYPAGTHAVRITSQIYLQSPPPLSRELNRPDPAQYAIFLQEIIDVGQVQAQRSEGERQLLYRMTTRVLCLLVRYLRTLLGDTMIGLKVQPLTREGVQIGPGSVDRLMERFYKPLSFREMPPKPGVDPIWEWPTMSTTLERVLAACRDYPPLVFVNTARSERPLDIIITVPHGRCPPGTAQRLCDLRAVSAATIIKRKFDARLEAPQFRISLEYGDQFRADIDLNRRNARTTSWRRSLQRTIQDIKRAERDVLVIDVHSFPNVPEAFTVQEDPTNVPHIVLLDYLDRHGDLATRLPRLSVLPAADTNDITLEALENRADALLFEFNESERYLPDRYIHEMASALADEIKVFGRV